jgi:N-acetylglutamate synthase-like GNAT family acetyltransferase
MKEFLQVKFTSRPATAEDDPAIRRLVQIGRINPTGLDWRRFIVAIASKGEVIGCGQVKPHGDGSRELASIVVDPEWRGQGVARAIIERLLNEHPGDLHLMCRSRLEPFYEKFGFRSLSQAEMPRYFRRISRVAGLLHALQGEEDSLLVMRRNGNA